MSDLAADAIGLLGSTLFIAAFAYANLTSQLDKLWFNFANLAGSLLLLISLSVHFNLAAFVLETAWGAIALAGIIGAVRQRRRERPL
jgi:hypothetical protein